MSDLSAAESAKTHDCYAITHVLSVMPGNVILPRTSRPSPHTLQIPIRDTPFEELAGQPFECCLILPGEISIWQPIGHQHAAGELLGLQLGEPSLHFAQDAAAPDDLELKLARPVFLLTTCTQKGQCTSLRWIRGRTYLSFSISAAVTRISRGRAAG